MTKVLNTTISLILVLTFITGTTPEVWAGTQRATLTALPAEPSVLNDYAGAVANERKETYFESRFIHDSPVTILLRRKNLPFSTEIPPVGDPVTFHPVDVSAIAGKGTVSIDAIVQYSMKEINSGTHADVLVLNTEPRMYIAPIHNSAPACFQHAAQDRLVSYGSTLFHIDSHTDLYGSVVMTGDETARTAYVSYVNPTLACMTLGIAWRTYWVYPNYFSYEKYDASIARYLERYEPRRDTKYVWSDLDEVKRLSGYTAVHARTRGYLSRDIRVMRSGRTMQLYEFENKVINGTPVFFKPHSIRDLPLPKDVVNDVLIDIDLDWFGLKQTVVYTSGDAQSSRQHVFAGAPRRDSIGLARALKPFADAGKTKVMYVCLEKDFCQQSPERYLRYMLAAFVTEGVLTIPGLSEQGMRPRQDARVKETLKAA